MKRSEMKRVFEMTNPAVALCYFAGLVFLLFAFSDIYHRAIAAAGLVALAFFFVGLRKTLKTLKWVVPLGLLVILLNPLFNRRGATVLFYLWGGSVTLESVLLGVCQALMLMGIVLLFQCFNQVIDRSAFLNLLGGRMPRTALFLNLSLHSVTRLSRRARDLLDTQRANRVTMPKMKFALELLNAFTAGSLEEGMEMAEVIKARDYGTARRTRYRLYAFKRWDVCFLGVMLGLLVFSSFSCIGFGLYVLFPLIIELRYTALP